MNEREKFYRAFPKHAGVLEMDEAGSISSLESITARHQFAVWKACAESKQAELDKANARIAQLEEFILSITKCSGGMINGNRAAMAAENALTASSNTWLSERDAEIAAQALEAAADDHSGGYVSAARLRRLAKEKRSIE